METESESGKHNEESSLCLRESLLTCLSLAFLEQHSNIVSDMKDGVLVMMNGLTSERQIDLGL